MCDAYLQIGEWQLDPRANLIFDANRSTKLEYKQIQLLLYLISKSGLLVTKQELLDEIWAGRVVVDDVITVAISRLRKALNDSARSPKFIKTVPGVGYKFILPLSPSEIAQGKQYYSGQIGLPEPGDRSEVITHGYKRKLKHKGVIAIMAMAFILVVIGWSTQNGAPVPTGQQQAEFVPQPVSESILAKYQDAVDLRNSYDPQKALAAAAVLEHIIVQAPEFADAYILLAKIKCDILFKTPLIGLHASEELKALIAKALMLNPQSSTAHETLGGILFYMDWNHQQARYHLEKAIELDPENSEAHHAYGVFLLAHKDFDKSYRHINIARKLNPLYYSITTVAWLYAMQGRSEEAWQETEKLLTYRPNELQYHRSALRLFEHSGDVAKAYQHLRKILQLAEYRIEELDQLDTIFAQKGLTGVYHWLAYTRQEDRDIGFYPAPLSLARFAVSAGQYDDAFDWLNQALDQHQPLLLWLAVDPHYQPIRSDVRYHRLVEKLGLVADGDRPG